MLKAVNELPGLQWFECHEWGNDMQSAESGWVGVFFEVLGNHLKKGWNDKWIIVNSWLTMLFSVIFCNSFWVLTRELWHGRIGIWISLKTKLGSEFLGTRDLSNAIRKSWERSYYRFISCKMFFFILCSVFVLLRRRPSGWKWEPLWHPSAWDSERERVWKTLWRILEISSQWRLGSEWQWGRGFNA